MSKANALKIYCSGPLFCAEEVGGMQAIANTLEEAGLRTFLPHRDGLEPWVMRFANAPGQNLIPRVRQQIDRAIFCLDVYEVAQACDALVFNMNGRVPDEGGVVEVSIAYAVGKPVILYKNDVRAPFGGQDNAMLIGLTGGKQVHSLKSLPLQVTQTVKHTGKHQGELSPALASAIDTGRRISALINKLPQQRGKQTWDESVINRIVQAVE